jgi:hypothetical protein
VLTVRTFREDPVAALNPRTLGEGIVTRSMRPSRYGLGPYTEPEFISKMRGSKARSLGDCRTTVVAYGIAARDIDSLLRLYTTTTEHRAAMASVQGVVDKSPALRPVSGTFMHLIRSPSDLTLPAMARSMDLLWKNEGRSTRDVCHIQHFDRFFEVA